MDFRCRWVQFHFGPGFHTVYACLVRKYRVECQQCVHNSSNTLHTCHACCYEAETRRDEAADRSSRDSTLSAVRLPSVIFLGRRKTRKKSTIMNSFGKSRASTDNSTTSSSMGSSCDYTVCCRTSPIDPMKCVVLSWIDTDIQSGHQFYHLANNNKLPTTVQRSQQTARVC